MTKPDAATESPQTQSTQTQSTQTTTTATIVNELGLHLRAAARFVAVASQWQCQVRVSTDGPEVDGKSLLALSSLLARRGTVLTIRCEGDGHAQAASTLCDVVATGFRDSPRSQ